ncbi:PREDICTED: transcription termination factor 1-like [Eufriesea mexicana]|uniref:transcription termination factor 1-like n=1 Tax=Eufriesea mexicana TaxID=516756 RepID=UPI00083BBC0C|nr:PREDICTED: transcription termination factor 1-like [Eufriesea mexicana]
MLKNITNCSDPVEETNENNKIGNINRPQNFNLSDLELINLNLMELAQETLCKKENLYSCNKEDMLHDLNSLVDFEESNISTNIFSSTMINPTQEENITELSKNAEIDLLFTDNIDNANVENTENQEIKYKDTMLQEKKCFNNKKNIANNTKKNWKHKSNKKDTDVDDHIKYILGEVDIELTSGEEETLNEVSEDTINALYNLKVKLMHKVPMQHRIEHTAGSRTLTRKENKLFLNYGPMKSGTFTPNEDKIIRNNWEAFCEVHNWNPKCVTPFINMKNGYKFYIKSLEERQKFTQFLANGLPWRTLYSVYHRFKYLYGKHKKRFQRFTLNEDINILSYVKDKQNIAKNKIFLELSKILSRSRQSIWRRYQLLQKMLKNKKPSSEIKWTLSSTGKFIKTFMSVALCKTVEDLKDAIIPKPVWQKLEEKLDIDYNILRTFWIHQLHMQLFCTEPIYLNDIKIKLIEYVYGKGISNIREIVWSDVAKYFDGITSIFLCKTFFYLTKQATKKIGTNHFPDIVQYLYNEKIQDIKDELSDKFLPRLSYNNGNIKIIDKGLDEDIDI